MRRIAVFLSGVVAFAATLLGTAQAAFAMRITPTGGGGTAVTPVPHHTGLEAWQISLIVVAGVLVTIAMTAVALRLWHRATPKPAFSSR